MRLTNYSVGFLIPRTKTKKNIFLDIDSYTNRYIIISNLCLNNILIKDIRQIF
jgi:hypothetical protein